VAGGVTGAGSGMAVVICRRETKQKYICDDKNIIGIHYYFSRFMCLRRQKQGKRYCRSVGG
jgi:hypothetical protein